MINYFNNYLEKGMCILILKTIFYITIINIFIEYKFRREIALS